MIRPWPSSVIAEWSILIRSANKAASLSSIPRNPQPLAASLRGRCAESSAMQRQTKITIGEIVLTLIIAAEVIIFIGYTKPGRSILNSLGLTAITTIGDRPEAACGILEKED